MACKPCIALLGALALLAASVPAASAADGYRFGNPTMNFDTYYNVSADIADIQALAKAGDFAGANAIYTYGKNAYRNIAAGTFRIARGVATAGNGHAGEAYYEMFKTFYNTTTFLDSWLGAALNGTGEYAASPAYRTSSVAMYASVYGWIYILHEADVGTLMMRGYSSPLRNITRNPTSATVEIDDAYTLWLGKGCTSPIETALNAARQACISADAVDAQMQGVLDGFNQASDAAVVAKTAGNTTANIDFYASRYQQGRNKMVAFIVRSWVQIALNNLRAASTTANAAKRPAYQAAAKAAFRAVAPFINSMKGGPRAVARSFRAIDVVTKMSFSQMREALTTVYAAQGINIRSIYACN